jgi:hypothetical protein
MIGEFARVPRPPMAIRQGRERDEPARRDLVDDPLLAQRAADIRRQQPAPTGLRFSLPVGMPEIRERARDGMIDVNVSERSAT